MQRNKNAAFCLYVFKLKNKDKNYYKTVYATEITCTSMEEALMQFVDM